MGQVERPSLHLPEQKIAVMESSFRVEGVSHRFRYLKPPSSETKGAVLLIHGAGTTRSKGKDLFRELQSILAEAGYASLAYDETGVGESTGDFSDSTLTNRLSAAKAAVAQFSELLPSETDISILGLSMGGHIAARLAGEENARTFTCLIQVNAAAYEQAAEDKNLGPGSAFTQIIRNTKSWEDSLAFAAITKFRGPVLMANSEHDNVISKEVKEGYKRRVSPNKLTEVTLPDVDHPIFSSDTAIAAAARERLYDKIVDFLDSVHTLQST